MTIDEKVAKIIFGLVPCVEWEEINFGSAGGPALRKLCTHPNNTCFPVFEIGSIYGNIGGCPKFSSDLKLAWEVIKKLEKLYHVQIQTLDPEEYHIEIWTDKGTPSYYRLLAESDGPIEIAICEAALLAYERE